MKMAFRKSLALILCVSLCLSFIPTVKADFVASGTWGNLSWTLDNMGLLTISGNGEMQNASFNSPYPWKEYRDSIISVVINEGVTSISDSAFGGRYAGGEPDSCSNLTSVTIPSSVMSIGAYAFWDCSNLTSINIPFGVTNIEEWAFRECDSLTSINIPSSVTNIGECAFSGCTSLTGIDVDDANQTYCDLDGVLFDKSGSTIMCFPGGRSGDYNIPSNVTAIEKYAFFGCNNLTGVTIPTSVATISEYSFESCKSLARVTIPDSVTKIDNSAFMGCSGLTNITIPSNVTFVGHQAFQGCGLASITIPSGVTFIGTQTFAFCNHLSSVTIPSGVTSIMTGAFWRCGGLKSVRIPSSVTSIESSAFADCSALAEIYYEGTEGEWGAISIEAGNDILTSANIHYDAGTAADDPVIDPSSGISVFESVGDPVITSFRFYQDVDGTEYVDLTDSTETLTVNYKGSADPYKFVIEVDRPELINHIYITGVAADGVRQMEAEYDAALNAFISKGYFDVDDVYFQPESISLEYSVKTTAPEIGHSLNWNEMMPYLGSLKNADVSIAQTGSTNVGTVNFSGTVDKLNKIALNYSIKTLDAGLGTEFGTLRSYYQTGEDILSYVVPGLNDSKYYAYLDFSDPLSYKMLLDDGLNAGGKIIELEMTFSDTESSQFLAYEDMAKTFSDIAMISKVIGETYKICKENEELRQEIAASAIIEDKSEAFKKADDYKYDQIAFVLLTTALPILVASGPMGAAPAMLFTAIIGVITAASDVMYDYRVAGFLGKEVKTEWFKGLSVGLVKCGDNAFMKITPDGHLKVYGKGNTYDFEAYNHPCYIQEPFKSTRVYKVTVGDGVTGLGKNLFYNCSYLTDVNIADSVEYIGVQCFKYCNRLEKVRLPGNLKTIDTEAFSGTGLREIIFPSSLEQIGVNAFSSCTLLEQIEIPENVINIGAAAFQGCDNLVKAVLPDSITSVSNGMFYNCINLADVQLSDQIKEIGEYAFYYCKKLVTINLDNVTSIGPHAFDTCWELTGILSLKNVANLGEYAFSECHNINGVIFSDELKEIQKNTFYYCRQLSKLFFPEGLLTIGEHAFYDCYCLDSEIIVIPPSVTHIGDYAFGMSYIDERDNRMIYFTGSPPTMNQCFYNNYASIYYPIDKGWTANDRYDYGESVVWIPGGPELGACDFTLPADIKYIMDSAFEGLSARSVFIPDNCISIGENAFKGSKLTRIRLPGMCSISDTAFDDCGYILVYSEGGSNVERYCESHDNCIFISEF